jgi:hypothetical protein
MEDNLKKKMEDTLDYLLLKNWSENLKNGRRPQQKNIEDDLKKRGRRPQKK